MWALLTELGEILLALWNTANRLVRLFVLFLVLPPFLLILVSWFGSPGLTLFLTIFFVLGSVLLMIFLRTDIITVVAFFPMGREALRWFAGIIAFELTMGIYLAIFPIWDGPGFVLLILVAFLVVIFTSIALGTPNARWLNALRTVMIVVIVVLTVASLYPPLLSAFQSRLNKILQGVTEIVDGDGIKTPSSRSTTYNLLAMPGAWTENFSVPPGYWWRIYSKERVRVKFLNGRVIDDEEPMWAGNDIQDANFRIMSLESHPVEVAVLLEPK